MTSTSRSTSLVLYSVVVRTPPRAVMLRDVAVVRGVADRAVDELANKISMSDVAKGFPDDVNQNVVECDRLVAPPRHGTLGIKVQRLDRRVRGLARPAIAIDNVIPRHVRRHEEAGVVLGPVVEPRIRLPHGSTKDRTEVAELNTRQVLDDPEEIGSALNERATDVVLRKVVQLPDGNTTGGLQIAMQDLLHGVQHYAELERKARVLCPD